MSEDSCYHCRRPLSNGEGKPVPLFFRLAAAFALAPVHIGMWLWEIFGRDYCVRCRRKLSAVSLLLAAGVLTLAFLGFRWAHRKGIL
jgi:hypothetical protein